MLLLPELQSGEAWNHIQDYSCSEAVIATAITFCSTIPLYNIYLQTLHIK